MTPQQNTTEFPVIISGGGPIGMATALVLARQGARSVVLERNTSPHCGQSHVPPHARPRGRRALPGVRLRRANDTTQDTRRRGQPARRARRRRCRPRSGPGLAEVPTPTGVRRHLLTRADTMTRNPRGIDVISDSTGALVSAYSGPRDQLYLVRPDCHLAVRIELADPDALAGAVERALGILAPTPPARPVPRPRARDRGCSSQWI